MSEVLLQRRDHNFVYLTLNRPDRRNALSIELFKALDQTAQALHRDRSLRAVIISGAGPDFCTGLDIKSVMQSPAHGLRLLRKWLPGNANLAQRVSRRWRKIPVPVIVALHGHCWGGGLQIALGGDFRIASPDTKLSIMESRWGLVPDMAGNLALRELVGRDQALRWAMTSESISAEQALRHGLISEIADNPIETATQLAQAISRRSPDAVAAIKTLYTRHWLSSERRLLAAETFAQLRMLISRNRKIAVKRATEQADLPYVERGKR